MGRFNGSFDQWIKDMVGTPTYNDLTEEQQTSCYYDYIRASQEFHAGLPGTYNDDDVIFEQFYSVQQELRSLVKDIRESTAFKVATSKLSAEYYGLGEDCSFKELVHFDRETADIVTSDLKAILHFYKELKRLFHIFDASTCFEERAEHEMR